MERENRIGKTRLEMSRTQPVRYAALIFAMALAGCATPNRPYQHPGQAEVAPSKLYKDNTPYGKLCAIELDEQGDLWESAQLRKATEMLRKSEKKPLLVVFIHGWQNNASPDNGNLQSFNQLLKGLAKELNSSTTEVEGVYIGWRGLAIDRTWDKTGIGELARYLSFYSRKNDTDLVAGIPLTRALYALANEAHARGGHVIFIGHSFGGRILEKALAQALVGQTAGTAASSQATLPADLTLLINPASEAITARRLKLSLTNWAQPTPAIVSITSVGDNDTLTWWGVAMKLATWTKTKSFRQYGDKTNQRDYVVSTAGHSPLLIDRQVVPLDPQPAPPAIDALRWNFESATTGQFRSADKWWSIREAPPVAGPFVMNGNQARAYWVISVPKEIIHDHNDIFNPAALDFVVALYKICQPTILKTPAQKAMTIPAAIGGESSGVPTVKR